MAVQRQQNSFLAVKRHLRGLEVRYSLLFPAWQQVVSEGFTHFFDTPESELKWLKSTGQWRGRKPQLTQEVIHVSMGNHRHRRKSGQRHPPSPRAVPNLEQIIKELRQAKKQGCYSCRDFSTEDDTARIPGDESSTWPSRLKSKVMPEVTPQTADIIL
ncbi:hypothetical protein NDU88_004327 [Pleurodeles waltl]|uniref:Uncharacterized protein n=1 Tax=Pleurodeles waltl TaxID=8319 RepID=A0AAV7NJ29_PLEWA|nr:hypothetical protein NDU88_004327 [Pleurodeles waltl]